MYTIFIEYKIQMGYKKQYLQARQHIDQLLKSQNITGFQVMEATDQPDLFVEMIQIDHLDSYKRWKQMIKDKDSSLPWEPIMNYIVGGRTKFNMWSFQPIPLSAYATGSRQNQV